MIWLFCIVLFPSLGLGVAHATLALRREAGVQTEGKTGERSSVFVGGSRAFWGRGKPSKQASLRSVFYEVRQGRQSQDFICARDQSRMAKTLSAAMGGLVHAGPA
ncbi:hypothetical protein RLO149_c018890 [Roseobacter litoralis Och 149]|uniref:Uncharacterized protein n=1 Tax=Roseobacter litoralis (strain ATCC 49566 / DSM 6996 / JCM 21268 / NBRC 15278 / OCh 149) TaxID=391595 RepID=F7ZJP6_ROSLO|nr:hypothetical protein RLO149_c018890 [Roseobacter litoralis Och 149]